MSMGEPILPRCANHPWYPGRLHDVPGVSCRNYRPRPATPEGDQVRMIPRGDGFYAYVDAADYEWLSQWKWPLCGRARMQTELSVINLHRMIWNARSMSCRIKDLGRLQWSMSPRYFDDAVKDLLVSTCAAGVRTDPDALARAVKRYVRKLDNVHPPDRYYRRTSPASI
jgi:hypothetical protein